MRVFRGRPWDLVRKRLGRGIYRLIEAHSSARLGFATKLCKLYKVYKGCIERRRVRMGCGEGAGGMH